MFSNQQGEWVSVSSEVPAYEVGKDCVRFQEDGRIEYSIEYEGRILKSLFEAKIDGEEYIIRPPNGFIVGDSLRIKISPIKEDEIGIARIGMTTVYRKKTEKEPNHALQTTTTAVTDRAPSSTLRASGGRV